MIQIAVVLFWVERLEQGARWVTIDAATELVDFVNEDLTFRVRKTN